MFLNKKTIILVNWVLCTNTFFYVSIDVFLYMGHTELHTNKYVKIYTNTHRIRRINPQNCMQIIIKLKIQQNAIILGFFMYEFHVFLRFCQYLYVGHLYYEPDSTVRHLDIMRPVRFPCAIIVFTVVMLFCTI